MTHVDARAERAFAGAQIRLDRVERRVFHHHDHDRRRQNRRQHGVLETVGEVVRSDNQDKRAFGPDWNRPHGICLLSWLRKPIAARQEARIRSPDGS